MTLPKVKARFCLLWPLCLISLFSLQMFPLAIGRAGAFEPDGKTKSNPKPEPATVDRFDKAIQQRFLIEPSLGITRIAPVFPPNPHLREFYPRDDEERNRVADFVKNNWKVDLYLFGRRAQPTVVDGKTQKEFTVNYRLNKPVSVTRDIKAKDLPKAEKLLDKVKVAFQEFQTPNSPNENHYEFSIGRWFYVARPVRASSESCLRCHTDYVITSKVKGDKYKFRKRKVGDVNGVLVYGFAKTN